MKVTILGGGPGGLYAAILLRRALPDVEVTLHERNAPDDTFGFGVVFSAATLAELEDADPVSHDRMASAWARWDPVEVRYRGDVLRAGGNRFAAISRHVLLRLLQERAIELGVDLRFRSEVVDPADLCGAADLVVAADGVNSVTRRRYAEVFQPRTVVEGSTYIWLGTDRVFDAFTFIFEETEHGPFQAHIYPFSDDRSTFIVECTRDVWRAAGLDAVDTSRLPPGTSDDHSIEFLSKLFADHLDGQDLLGNNSKWLGWTTVSNRRWRHGNVVLVGDAAHTAHFSIGSGTKLAMEDAIALTRELTRADDLDRALAAYEADRRPQVERVQQAAAESLAWFDRYPRYLGASGGGAGPGFPAPMFAYSLLTRSSRVDHDNLRRRDPALVLAFDRWFAERAHDGRHGRPRLLPPPPALTPLDVGPARLANRAVLAPVDPQDARDGVPSETLREAVAAAATGGAGLVLVPRLAVSPGARATPADAGLYGDAAVAAWRDLLAGREAGSAPAGASIGHAGPRASMRPRAEGLDRPLAAGGWERVAASAVPYTPAGPAPAALVEAGMNAVVAAFVDAAMAADVCGFDLLEVDAAHGNLLASFLSPLTNRRDDAYGGDVAARLRFPLTVLDAVRRAWPAAKPLSVRVSASDRAPGGLTAPDAVAVARALADHGADLVHVVTGQTTRSHQGDYDRCFNAAASDLVRNGAGVTTLVAGGVPTLQDVDHLVAGGRADLCVVGPLPWGRHGLVDEPDWLARLRDPDPRAATT